MCINKIYIDYNLTDLLKYVYSLRACKLSIQSQNRLMLSKYWDFVFLIYLFVVCICIVSKNISHGIYSATEKISHISTLIFHKLILLLTSLAKRHHEKDKGRIFHYVPSYIELQCHRWMKEEACISHHNMEPILIGIVVILYNISSENISSSYKRNMRCYEANINLEKKTSTMFH